MRVPHVTYLMILWFVFLVFVALISFLRPKGRLPATHGHLQTMADIADEVGDVLFFGDKGKANPALLAQVRERDQMVEHEDLDVRHAGTSSEPLPPVQIGVLYV